MFRFVIFIFFLFNVSPVFSQGYDVFGIGLFDVKFDGSETNNALDVRYERRFDNVLIDIGPEEDNFFYLKPFAGIELTSDSAFYIVSGIYLEDNLGQLFINKNNQWNFTPSFGFGYYDDGNGTKLGNNLEFRTTFEFSYELENLDRIGISFSHISNANIGKKNPGAEIMTISYQIPF